MKYDSCLGLRESGGLSSQGLLCSSWRCGWLSSNSHCIHTRRAVCPVPKVLTCALYVQSLNTQCGFLTEKNTIILASPVSPLWFLFFSIEGEGRNEAVRCKAVVSLSGRRWHEQKLEWIIILVWYGGSTSVSCCRRLSGFLVRMLIKITWNPWLLVKEFQQCVKQNTCSIHKTQTQYCVYLVCT